MKTKQIQNIKITGTASKGIVKSFKVENIWDYLNQKEEEIIKSYIKTDSTKHPSSSVMTKNLLTKQKWTGIKEAIEEWDRYHFDKVSKMIEDPECIYIDYSANIPLNDAIDIFDLNGMHWMRPENATATFIQNDNIRIVSHGVNLHGNSATGKIIQWLGKNQNMIQIIYKTENKNGNQTNEKTS